MATAFFDVDGTLLLKNSGPLYAKWLKRRGMITSWELLRTLYYTVLYKLDRLDATEFFAALAKAAAGDVVAEYRERGQQFFDEALTDLVRPSMLEALAAHRAAGDAVAILSASAPFLIDPLARQLAIEHVLCTRFAIADGRYTGALDGPPGYGAGKVSLARAFCEQRGEDLATATAYADSITDLPLLLAVGAPRVVNPDWLLRRQARRRGWVISD